MSQRAVALLSEAVDEVVELEDLLEVKYRITLLTQTMVVSLRSAILLISSISDLFTI